MAGIKVSYLFSLRSMELNMLKHRPGPCLLCRKPSSRTASQVSQASNQQPCIRQTSRSGTARLSSSLRASCSSQDSLADEQCSTQQRPSDASSQLDSYLQDSSCVRGDLTASNSTSRKPSFGMSSLHAVQLDQDWPGQPPPWHDTAGGQLDQQARLRAKQCRLQH